MIRKRFRQASMIQVVRSYSKTAAMSAAGSIGDSPLFVVDYLLRFIRVALLLAIWRTLFAHRAVVGGLPLTTVLTYTLIGEVFSEMLSGYTGLTEAFWDGSIGSRFLRPMSWVKLKTPRPLRYKKASYSAPWIRKTRRSP